MPSIDLCFQGWVRQAEVSEVIVVATGKKVDVSKIDVEHIVQMLNDRIWAISLSDYVNHGFHEEIELFDSAPAEK